MSVSLLSWYVFVRLFTFVVSVCLTDLSAPLKTATNKQTAKHNGKKPQIKSLLRTSSDHEDSKKKTGLQKGGLQQPPQQQQQQQKGGRGLGVRHFSDAYSQGRGKELGDLGIHAGAFAVGLSLFKTLPAIFVQGQTRLLRHHG